MKSKIPFILVALVTASIAYAAINYAGSSKAPAAGPLDCGDCCDPTAAPAAT